MKKTGKLQPQNSEQSVRQICRLLEKAESSGQHPWRIFEDWTVLVEAFLDAMPRLLAARFEGRPPPIPAEITERETEVAAKYREYELVLFREAIDILVNSTHFYADTVGEVFMSYGYPSGWHGQFFTPFHVAQAMANLAGVQEREVHERLKEAIAKSVPAQAQLLAGLVLPSELTLDHMIAHVIPLAVEQYEPIKVYDPACGSGVMFLAAASTLPSWMTQMGLVSFHGQDIDPLCVRMARINIMLYGLDGRYAPLLVVESAARLQKGEPPAKRTKARRSNGTVPNLARVSVGGCPMSLSV
jgi:hypothetical protein